MSFSRFVPHLQRGALVVSIVLSKSSARCDNLKATDDHQLQMTSLRPNKSDYEIIDWSSKKYEKMVKNNALFHTLYGEDMVEEYEVYKHKTKPEIMAILKFGNVLNGYPEILHGGISALVIDNSYGLLFMSQNLPPTFTANLNINYRQPIRQNSYCILRAEIVGAQGRKLHMKATIEDANTNEIQVESTTLFINMKISPWVLWLKQLHEYLT
eukprot:gene29195-32974_t